MEASGVNIKRGVGVARVDKTSEGLVVSLNTGEILPPTDVLLWAVGRLPNTDSLGCTDISLDLDNLELPAAKYF